MFTKAIALFMSSFLLPTSYEHLIDFDKYASSGSMLRSSSEKVKNGTIQKRSVTCKRHLSRNKPCVKKYRPVGKNRKDTYSKINLKTSFQVEVKSGYHSSQSCRNYAGDEEKACCVGNFPSFLNDTWIIGTSAVDRTSTQKNGHVSMYERKSSDNEGKSSDKITEVEEISFDRETENGAHFKEKPPINKYDFYAPQYNDTDDLSESNVVNNVLEMEDISIDKSSYRTQKVFDNNTASEDDSLVSTRTLFDIEDGDLISVLDHVECFADSSLQNLSQERTEKIDAEQVDKNTSQKNESEKKMALTITKSWESREEELPNNTRDVDYGSGITKAVEKSVREKSIHPIVKQELKFKLQLDRVTRGEEELFLEPHEPIQYKLREDEIQKKNARREQNRRSALKARDRERENVKILTETIDTKALESTRLMTEKRTLADKKAGLVKRIKEHLTHCTDKKLKEFTEEVLRSLIGAT